MQTDNRGHMRATTAMAGEAMPGKHSPLPVQWGFTVRQLMRKRNIVLAQQRSATDADDGGEIWMKFTKAACEGAQAVRFNFAFDLFGNEQKELETELSTEDYSLFLLQLRECCQDNSDAFKLVDLMKQSWDTWTQREGVTDGGWWDQQRGATGGNWMQRCIAARNARR